MGIVEFVQYRLPRRPGMRVVGEDVSDVDANLFRLQAEQPGLGCTMHKLSRTAKLGVLPGSAGQYQRGEGSVADVTVIQPVKGLDRAYRQISLGARVVHLVEAVKYRHDAGGHNKLIGHSRWQVIDQQEMARQPYLAGNTRGPTRQVEPNWNRPSLVVVSDQLDDEIDNAHRLTCSRFADNHQ